MVEGRGSTPFPPFCSRSIFRASRMRKTNTRGPKFVHFVRERLLRRLCSMVLVYCVFYWGRYRPVKCCEGSVKGRLFVTHTGALDDINVTPKAFLIASSKLYNCQTILSHTVFKYINSPQLLHTSLVKFFCLFFQQTELSMGQT